MTIENQRDVLKGKRFSLSQDNLIEIGADSAVFNCNPHVVKIYGSLNLKQVQEYQAFTNRVSKRLEENSALVTFPKGLEIPLKVNPIVHVQTSSYQNFPLAVSPWIAGENLAKPDREYGHDSGLGYYLLRPESYWDSKDDDIKSGTISPGGEFWWDQITSQRVHWISFYDYINASLAKFTEPGSFSISCDNVKISKEGIVITDLSSYIDRGSSGINPRLFESLYEKKFSFEEIIIQ